MNVEELRRLVPDSKHDTDKAEAIVKLGYPAVAPIIPEILEWIQDCNWPVAQVFVPFLQVIGGPLIPEIRRILSTDDDFWKYWVVTQIIAESPSLVEALRDELTRMAELPTASEKEETLDIECREILYS